MDAYKIIEGSYYYDADGKRDELAFMLPSCANQNCYMILKNNYAELSLDYHALFADVIAFYLCVTGDNIVPRSMIRHFYLQNKLSIVNFDHKLYKNNYDGAMECLENYINKSSPFMLCTVNEYLEASIFYNQNFEAVDYPPFGHSFLMLGRDNESNGYYYVDEPTLYSDKFCASKLRKDVGMITRKDLERAMKVHARITRCSVNHQSIQSINLNLREIIRESICLYNSSNTPTLSLSAGLVSIQGRRAIEALPDIFLSNIDRLNAKVFDFSKKSYSTINVFTEFFNGLGRIIARKTLLYNSISPQSCQVRILYNNLFDWKLVKLGIGKLFYGKNSDSIKSIISTMRGLLNSEDQVYEYLRRL